MGILQVAEDVAQGLMEMFRRTARRRQAEGGPIWVEAMITAMPVVKPMTTGTGMKLMALPRRAKARPRMRKPAIKLARARPSGPNCAMPAEQRPTKAPAGPPT